MPRRHLSVRSQTLRQNRGDTVKANLDEIEQAMMRETEKTLRRGETV